MVQKSKATWLNLGDDNTKYFHSFMRKKRYSRHIAMITSEHGDILTDQTDIHQHLTNYYQAFLGSPVQSTGLIDNAVISEGATLTFSQQLELVRPFSPEDVKNAMFAIDSHKSPGVDGFGSDFFKKAWSIVGEDVCAAILDFFKTGSLSPHLHHTFLVLIPKVDSPTHAGDYRPIACCATIYKCISKLLCTRLNKVLP